MSNSPPAPESPPYWLVNVPHDQWPASCPDFLLDQSEKNQRILSTPDAAFVRQTWAEVKEIIRTNRIDLLQRAPSDLRRYLAFTHRLKKEYGSVMDFVLTERLGWLDLSPQSPVPFQDPADLKILYNDWPYGVSAQITHLVVWVKFELAEHPDPLIDDLASAVRRAIDAYVDATFSLRLGRENVSFPLRSVTPTRTLLYLLCSGLAPLPTQLTLPPQVLWFRNWRSLKSVHTVEHFHVMLHDADPQFLREITRGDTPWCERE
ncbi:MAG: hypothetical protein M1829_001065 [Trizodia sp. TS-e1964]|nr:MAG: hypothetical protein M1829_001065 [Trizodia sp. TS-e1964]